jgi:hypothetical protein
MFWLLPSVPPLKNFNWTTLLHAELWASLLLSRLLVAMLVPITLSWPIQPCLFLSVRPQINSAGNPAVPVSPRLFLYECL